MIFCFVFCTMKTEYKHTVSGRPEHRLCCFCIYNLPHNHFFTFTDFPTSLPPRIMGIRRFVRQAEKPFTRPTEIVIIIMYNTKKTYEYYYFVLFRMHENFVLYTTCGDHDEDSKKI